MKKRMLSFVLAIVLICVMFGCEKGNTAGEFPESIKVGDVSASTVWALKNYQQTDEPWGGHGLGGSANIWCTGCGIVSACNAIHYATGFFIDPAGLADWANENDFGYHFDRTDGGVLFYHIGETFGEALGFKIDTEGAAEENGLPSVKLRITDSDESSAKEKMISLIGSGATLIAHVKNHFISINDYDYKTDRFLVWDNCAGILTDGGDGYGSNRVGITHAEGDWFAFEDFRGTKKNSKGSFDYFKVDYVVPIVPVKGEQLFFVERDVLIAAGKEQQENGKACNFTQIESSAGGSEVVFKGAYSSMAAPQAIGYKVDGGSTVYDESFLTAPEKSASDEGVKWCGKGALTRGFEVKCPVPDEGGHTYEIVVKTGETERIIWSAFSK